MYRLLYRLEKGGKHFEKYTEKIFRFLCRVHHRLRRLHTIFADGHESGGNKKFLSVCI